MSASILNASGCPPACGTPVVRVLTAGLDFADIPSDHSYLALGNIRNWMLNYNMETIPWNRSWDATFSNETETTPDTQGLSSTGVGLPNATYITDPTLGDGWNLYGFQRVQVLFSLPTNYLLLCVNANASGGYYYDQGCAGQYGGGCGVMEIPWSVIPGYPYVWLFLQGAYNSHAEIFPDLITLVDNTYGPPSLSAGPDWNQNQTCGGPPHILDPFGKQFS